MAFEKLTYVMLDGEPGIIARWNGVGLELPFSPGGFIQAMPSLCKIGSFSHFNGKAYEELIVASTLIAMF